MVSNYEKKNSRVPNARLEDPDAYFDILLYYFSGYSTKGISNHLGIPPQTVNRNLKKFRDVFLTSWRLSEVLAEEAAKTRMESADVYRWLLHGTYHHLANNADKGHADLHDCFKACPVSPSPSEFCDEFLGYLVDNNNAPSTIITALRPEHQLEDYFAVQTSRFACKACPFGEARKHFADVFMKFPEIYWDIMHYLSTHRTKRDEEFPDQFVMAIYVSFVRRLGEERHIACQRHDLDRETTFAMVARRHTRLRRRIYNLLALKSPADQEIINQVFYTSGSAPGT